MGEGNTDKGQCAKPRYAFLLTVQGHGAETMWLKKISQTISGHFEIFSHSRTRRRNAGAHQRLDLDHG